MWIYTVNGFMSIVAEDGFRSVAVKDRMTDVMRVRARTRKPLRTYFPGKRIIRDPKADYLFRVIVSRASVDRALAEIVREIDYPNFKNAAKANGLPAKEIGVISRVWGTVYQLQAKDPTPPTYVAGPRYGIYDDEEPSAHPGPTIYDDEARDPMGVDHETGMLNHWLPRD